MRVKNLQLQPIKVFCRDKLVYLGVLFHRYLPSVMFKAACNYICGSKLGLSV